MAGPDRLELLRRALRLLADQLRSADRVAIAVYAGAAGVVLESTPGDRREVIHAALERLEAGGSTAGAAGLSVAYELARGSRTEGSINRVILATDGDFNVGPATPAELVSLVERERRQGIFLTVIGVGRGNLNDELMEQVAEAGNGQCGYLDTVSEARRLLVEQLGATLHTLAEDVRVQVAFDADGVEAYRLLGYENRALADDAFDDEATDAAELGAGHSVTALYQLVTRPGVRPHDPLFEVRVRYRPPDAESTVLLTDELTTPERGDAPAAGFHLAAGAAEFALRVGAYAGAEETSYRSALASTETAAAAGYAAGAAELRRLILAAEELEGDGPHEARPR